jgi:c-di-GMP-related signal transduction protein
MTALSQPAERRPLIHVGRQPIYDRAGDVFAYELLFRDAAHAVAASHRNAHATSRVIVSAFTEFGLQQLAGSKACFINVTREFLIGELPIPFDSSQAVLEIIETVDVDDVVIDGVRDLIARGFTIALDDFIWGASSEQLLDLATYVKIDMADVQTATWAEIVQRFARFPHVQLIAERLETEEQLRQAFDLGFALFQGHVLGHPHVMSTVGLSPSRISRLQLVTALTADEVDVDDVTSLIIRDPAISYRLLQATNSAASGLSTRVSSVNDAIMLLGLDTVRHWVTLMFLSDMADATEEQLISTMTRARMCQLLAEQSGQSGDQAFTVGLLSSVADLIAEPSATLATQLPLAENIHSALTSGGGALGRVLTTVRRYELGEADDGPSMIDPDKLISAYLSAMAWSQSLFSDVNGTPAAAVQRAP